MNMPGVFRSGRSVREVEEGGCISLYFRVDFLATADAKRLKRAVQDMLDEAIAREPVMIFAYSKANGRGALISFTARDYASHFARRARDSFGGALDVWAMNNGGLKIKDQSNLDLIVREWRGCEWCNVLIPDDMARAGMGYTAIAGIGLKIAE